MTIRKGDPQHELASIEKPNAPYDDKGRFVPLNCPLPECGSGTLRYQGNGVWECDGLIDPDHPDKPLEACWYFHRDGKPRADGGDGDSR